MTIKFNRADYMANRCSHDAYYGQFVTPMLREFVARNIGQARIETSTDEHFSDIPLDQWDKLEGGIRAHCGSLLVVSNASIHNGTLCISLSDTVCVAKAAARIIRDLYTISPGE